MAFATEHDAIRKVVIDYLEGMIYCDEAKLRRAFHSQACRSATSLAHMNSSHSMTSWPG